LEWLGRALAKSKIYGISLRAKKKGKKLKVAKTYTEDEL
jgi:hypothetical protein